MKLLIYCFANKSTGLGHWFRSLAFAKEAKRRGHLVFIASDRMPPRDYAYLPCRYNSPSDLAIALTSVTPDWLVVDLPDTLPLYIEQIARCRICALNAIHYDHASNADLRVIQGVAAQEWPPKPSWAKTLMGAEYVILRPELKAFKGMVNDDAESVFVWGGAADRLNLLSRFSQLYPDTPTRLVTTNLGSPPTTNSPCHLICQADTPELALGWMATSKRAVVAMGMICWELCYLGIPAHVFSHSEIHLLLARRMSINGLIRAYSGVGLPDNEQMKEFLSEPFKIRGQPPDLKGAERILKVMEVG